MGGGHARAPTRWWSGCGPGASQALVEKVVLHEALRAVCAHLPSQPGRDPYDQASRLGIDNNTIMHEDLTSIVRAFPDNTPLW